MEPRFFSKTLCVCHGDPPPLTVCHVSCCWEISTTTLQTRRAWSTWRTASPRRRRRTRKSFGSQRNWNMAGISRKYQFICWSLSIHTSPFIPWSPLQVQPRERVVSQELFARYKQTRRKKARSRHLISVQVTLRRWVMKWNPGPEVGTHQLHFVRQILSRLHQTSEFGA